MAVAGADKKSLWMDSVREENPFAKQFGRRAPTQPLRPLPVRREHNGEDPSRDRSIGRIVRSIFKRQIVVVDLPE